MIRRVISGGQTGADMAGLLAARDLGIETGGTAPRGYKTENGSNARLVAFGLVESVSRDYPPRTEANVREADATLIISPGLRLGTGSRLTQRLCERHDKSWLHWQRLDKWSNVYGWLEHQYRVRGAPLVLNVAGSRESKWPGLEAEARGALKLLFQAAKERLTL